jgi:hypothetical protein
MVVKGKRTRAGRSYHTLQRSSQQGYHRPGVFDLATLCVYRRSGWSAVGALPFANGNVQVVVLLDLGDCQAAYNTHFAPVTRLQ